MPTCRHAILAVTLLAVACTFGATRTVLTGIDPTGVGVATDYNGTTVFVGTQGAAFRLTSHDLETGAFLAGHRLRDDLDVVAMAQDPWNRDAALVLHENGAVVSWTPDLVPTVITKGPPVPPGVQITDMDASEEGDLFLAARRQNADLTWDLFLVRLREGTWTASFVAIDVDQERPRLAFDDERDEVIMTLWNEFEWARFDSEMQVLDTGLYPLSFRAADIDIIEGVLLVVGGGEAALFDSVTGELQDQQAIPEVYPAWVQFAANPDTAVFEAVIRGGDRSGSTDAVVAVTVE